MRERERGNNRCAAVILSRGTRRSHSSGASAAFFAEGERERGVITIIGETNDRASSEAVGES